jgi:nitrogen fixation-related uncharacterized protein
MDFTWIAILASLCFGMGAVLIFIFAVKKNYFQDVEDAKYHVFWSDLEETVNSEEHEKNGKDSASAHP